MSDIDGQFNDKDVLPAYDMHGGPPGYAEVDLGGLGSRRARILEMIRSPFGSSNTAETDGGATASGGGREATANDAPGADDVGRLDPEANVDHPPSQPARYRSAG
jgi:hypothetical protein